ncbi:MAG: hypothetical protein R3A46_16660 [Thermomicrobiales bacterium]
MTDRDGENERLAILLTRLLEAETGEDAMICHDGGFRYAGDFMSMEMGLVEPASFIDEEDSRLLKSRGFIVDSPDGIQVTDAGRRFATGNRT